MMFILRCVMNVVCVVSLIILNAAFLKNNLENHDSLHFTRRSSCRRYIYVPPLPVDNRRLACNTIALYVASFA
jgi:hypothetical protein